MQPPEFWRYDSGIARLLDPLGRIVGHVTSRRVLQTPQVRPPVPVISVGNLTVGGTGKTPVAMSLVALLQQQGHRPAVVLRGYRGREHGPLQVDASHHTSFDVGDEALLHAAAAPCWIARARADGALAAAAAGASVVVLDDGHQHPGIAKDFSLVVVDGRAAFGNGRILPAGPLRESVEAGLARADAVVVMGDDPKRLAERFAVRLPVLCARLVPGPEQASMRGQRVVAFAGIGVPAKFFATLHDLGARVVASHPFEDHYGYTATDIEPILEEAYRLQAIPVTTAKDAVRLPQDQRQQVNVLSTVVEWEDEAEVERLLAKTMGGARPASS